MPAQSRAQQAAAAIAEHAPGQLYARNRGFLKMTHAQRRAFAETKRKGLPRHAKKRSITHGSTTLGQMYRGSR